MRRGRGRAAVVLAALGTVATASLALVAPGRACTNLATLALSSEAGHPGDTIILTGTSFPVRRGDPPTPVTVHWRSTDGPVLATLTPDRTGTIGTTFTVPPSDPGPVVIVAIQRRPVVDPAAPDAPPTAFVDEYGTPARVTFRVLAPGERSIPSVVPSEAAVGPADGEPTAMIVLLLLFGAVALSLFGGGVIAFVHQVRSGRVPERQWVRRPPYRDW